ncbi:MAG TPA: hypothetical protein VII45_08935 [Solirubrobacterales bacterium]
MNDSTHNSRRPRPSAALLISCIALFLTLSGTALALPHLSVRSAQIVDGTVRTVDLRDNAVTSPKIAPDSVGSSQIAENAIGSPEVAPDSLTAGDLGPDSVGASEIAADSVHPSELGPIVQRTNSATIQTGKTGSVSVNCAEGEQVISGGGQPSVFGVEMTSTRPQSNGWLYQAKNNTGSDQTITAFALCLS